MAGCAASTTADVSGPADGEAVTVASEHRARRTRPPPTAPASPYGGPSCPETHAEAKQLRASCDAPPYRCVYPEGECLCQSAQQCGGAERPPGPSMWLCDPPVREPCPPYP